jgi:hypothetical protein
VANLGTIGKRSFYAQKAAVPSPLVPLPVCAVWIPRELPSGGVVQGGSISVI